MLLALLGLTGAVARAQELTSADKERAMQYLESTKKNIVEAATGLSPAQWNFKAAPDRWSAAEVMEHIAAAEDFIRGIIVDKAMKGPAEPGRDLKKTDDAVVAMIPDRSHKIADSGTIEAHQPLRFPGRFGKTLSRQPGGDRAIPEQHAGFAPACCR